MSVLDDLRKAEQRVAQRLKELEPAVAEYQELQEVAKRLGIDPVASTPPAAPQSTARRRSRRVPILHAPPHAVVSSARTAASREHSDATRHSR